MEPASSAESRAVPRARPAAVETEPTPAAPSELPNPSGSSELDALNLPYASRPVRRSEPAPLPSIETQHPPGPAEGTLLEPGPKHDPLPRPKHEPYTEPQFLEESSPLDPVEEALAGQNLVPADTHHVSHGAKMPWYLRRVTLIGLALLAVLLVAVVVSLS